MPDAERTPPRRRVNGEASEQKILQAATEIAAERGYEGTSIGRVSERSGLPASSIYWHFKDKDALIAAVIDHSFETWLAHAGGAEPDGDTGSVDDQLGRDDGTDRRSVARVVRLPSTGPDVDPGATC